jgi:transcriptional regulator
MYPLMIHMSEGTDIDEIVEDYFEEDLDEDVSDDMDEE